MTPNKNKTATKNKKSRKQPIGIDAIILQLEGTNDDVALVTTNVGTFRFYVGCPNNGPERRRYFVQLYPLAEEARGPNDNKIVNVRSGEAHEQKSPFGLQFMAAFQAFMESDRHRRWNKYKEDARRTRFNTQEQSVLSFASLFQAASDMLDAHKSGTELPWDALEQAVSRAAPIRSSSR